MNCRERGEPRVHGLSGDHGWNDSDESPLVGIRSILFLVAGTAYFGSVWLLSGLAPLPMLVSRLCKKEYGANTNLAVDAKSTSARNWRNTPA